MKKELSKLSKVELRDVWGHEATDFTNWLSRQENLEALSEEIGVDIKLIKTEANVGKYSVDILAEEEASGRKIIIENQLEETDHDHLGKIITYASGSDAAYIIWIVQGVRDEHQKAIDWLNEHTDEGINFFLIKIELWQIEGSNPAPKFEIIVSPNEWAKAIKNDVASGQLTSTKIQQLDFWKRFKEYVGQHDTRMRLQSPRPQHWYNVSMGSSEAHIGLTMNTRENLIGCEFWINRNKELFSFLSDHKEEIEKEMGETADWVDSPISSSIKIRKEVPDVFKQDEAEKYFAWLYEKTVLFQKIFGNYCREFKR